MFDFGWKNLENLENLEKHNGFDILDLDQPGKPGKTKCLGGPAAQYSRANRMAWQTIGPGWALNWMYKDVDHGELNICVGFKWIYRFELGFDSK